MHCRLAPWLIVAAFLLPSCGRSVSPEEAEAAIASVMERFNAIPRTHSAARVRMAPDFEAIARDYPGTEAALTAKL